MFCKVCGFRVVRVWESHRTSRRFGSGYGSVTELTEVPGIVERACLRNSQKFRAGTKHAESPGIVARVVQNSQKLVIECQYSWQ